MGQPVGDVEGKKVAGEMSKRTVYTPEECAAIAKSISNNQTRDGLSNCIYENYEILKLKGAKWHNPDEMRKTWDRIKAVISRFCSIYENNTRSMNNGQTVDDVKEFLF